MVTASQQSKKKKLSKSDVFVGGSILAVAMLSAASTASCVEALPHETPSILRGLWRQVLTSIFFSILTLAITFHGRFDTDDKEGTAAADEETSNLLAEEGTTNTVSKERIGLVAIAVLGSTLLNDAIIFALQYASSAAVMCLCNTTPIWLILYAIIKCGIDFPGKITILGASISLVGAIICSTSKGDDGSEHANESLGALIALVGAVGGAAYMTACRELMPVGINPIILSLTINLGMATTTFILCNLALPNGISMFSTNVQNGFFGFLNPAANPAAFLHSIFPDMFGNLGAMIALGYFEPLIVSMVFLTEPLTASIIAMKFVGEAPPSTRTIVGVAIVLTGCLIVLLRANTTVSEPVPNEEVEETEAERQILRRERASKILYSQVNTVAPTITAQAISVAPTITPQAAVFTRIQQSRNRRSLPNELLRRLQLGDEERDELGGISSVISRSLHVSLIAPRNEFRRLTMILLKKDYGTMGRVDEEVE